MISRLQQGLQLNYCPSCGRPLSQPDSEAAREEGRLDCTNPECYVDSLKKSRKSLTTFVVKVRMAAAL